MSKPETLDDILESIQDPVREMAELYGRLEAAERRWIAAELESQARRMRREANKYDQSAESCWQGRNFDDHYRYDAVANSLRVQATKLERRARRLRGKP